MDAKPIPRLLTAAAINTALGSDAVLADGSVPFTGDVTAPTVNGNTIGAGSTSGANTGDQSLAGLATLGANTFTDTQTIKDTVYLTLVCDGVTNDAPALQAAINSAKRVIIQNVGTCLLGAKITVAAAVEIEGAGRGTILKLANGINDHVFSVTASNVSFRNLTIDGNRANQTAGSVIRVATGLSELLLHNVAVKSGYLYGLFLTSTSAVRVDGCTFSDSGSMQIYHIPTASAAASDIKILNSVIDGTTGPASFCNILFDTSGQAAATLTGVVIANNIVTYLSTAARETDGIVLSTGGTGGAISDVTITGNTIGGTNAASPNSNGIELYNVKRSTISGNSILYGYNGILVEGTSSNASVTGNSVVGIGSGNGMGIEVLASSDASVTGNTVSGYIQAAIGTVDSTRASVTGNVVNMPSNAIAGLRVSNSSEVVVASNTVVGGGGGPFAMMTGGTTVTGASFRGNRVSNSLYGFVPDATTNVSVVVAGNTFAANVTSKYPYGITAGVTIVEDDAGALSTYGTISAGVAGTSVGTLQLNNVTSGSIKLQPPTGALGSSVITVPAATDTLVALAATQTLTNKTLTGPVMSAPVLGTPASGTLTNATGLPPAGVVGTAAVLGANTFTAQQNLPAGSAATPSLAFGTSNTGLFSSSGTIIDLSISGATAFRFSANGFFFSTSVGVVELSSLGAFAWANGTAGSSTRDAFLTRAAAATLQQGAADAASAVDQIYQAQGNRVATDSNGVGSKLTLRPGRGTGNATNKPLVLQSYVAVTSGSATQTATDSLVIQGGAPCLVSSTVAGLPVASTVPGGMRYVTDASTTAALGIGTTVVGGGANIVKVWSDGTNWVYG